MNIVVVAASAGGVTAIGDVLSGLPAAFPAAVLAVQHRPANLPSLLARVLGSRTSLPVKDAEDGELIQSGTVYLAPPDRHLLLDPDGAVRLSKSAKVKYARPAADVLFESVAAHHNGRIVAVILTGHGGDGSAGAQAVKRAGGVVIAQDPASAEAPSMPASALLAGAVDEVLPLKDIAARLLDWVAAPGSPRSSG